MKLYDQMIVLSKILLTILPQSGNKSNSGWSFKAKIISGNIMRLKYFWINFLSLHKSMTDLLIYSFCNLDFRITLEVN